MKKILKPVAEKELEMDINQIFPEEKGIYAAELSNMKWWF